jgi:hypothetical protein
MRSTRLMSTALPCSGLWAAYVRRMMDPDYRLVLRWCAHLDFEDVLRIDHGSIHAAHSDPARELGEWRIVFGNGRLAPALLPSRFVNMTEQYIVERSRACGTVAPHDTAVFSESYGEPITRASLAASIRRALMLVRLSDAFLSGGVRRDEPQPS